MKRYAKKPVVNKFLVILLQILSGSAYADSYLCVPELSTGFIYSEELDKWESSDIRVGDRKYLISPADENDIFTKALKFDYKINEIGSTKPFIHCKTVKLTDSNKESGIMRCRDATVRFTFNKLNGRYIRSNLTGYVNHEPDADEESSTPFIEIGKCRAQ